MGDHRGVLSRRDNVLGHHARAADGERTAVTCTLHLAWDDRLTRYDFGPGHPLAPVRVELTVELARDFGVLEGPGVSVAAPKPATLPTWNWCTTPATSASSGRSAPG